MSAMPIHFLPIFKLLKWSFLKIDRFRRSFMWRGTDSDNLRGGHYLVNWEACLRPKKWGGGGLGIRDLEKINRALRLKWLWQFGIPEKGNGGNCSAFMIEQTEHFSSLQLLFLLGMAKRLLSEKQNGFMELLQMYWPPASTRLQDLKTELLPSNYRTTIE
jgi:hypothetical protein